MASTETLEGISLTVSDVSGQKVFRVPRAPAEATVGELVQSLLSQMHLPAHDPQGQPLAYQARLERGAALKCSRKSRGRPGDGRCPYLAAEHRRGVNPSGAGLWAAILPHTGADGGSEW